MQNKKNIVRDEIGQIIKNQKQKFSSRISQAVSIDEIEKITEFDLIWIKLKEIKS